jgi:branched-chain amino acid transport system ATP-binding protein
MKNHWILQTKDLSISFGGLCAVNKVNFDVGRGEVVGLIGPNGSGKTTFFNLISGIYKPAEGEVWFNSRNIVGEKPHEITRKGMARTFQSSRLFWELSILDNVVIGMHSKQQARLFDIILRYKKAKDELKRCCEEALEVLGYFSLELRDSHLKPVVDLPQGERRKVEICRALVSDPSLLLLDEPSAGMSPGETERLMEDIRKVKAKYKDISIIIIEHDMSVIEKIAQRVIVFNYGKKIAEGPFSEVAKNHEVIEAYLGGDK